MGFFKWELKKMENIESLDFQVWQIDKDDNDANVSAKLRLELYEVDERKYRVELLTDDETGHLHTIIAREFLAYEYAKNYFDMVERNTDAYLWLLTSFDHTEFLI